MRKSMGFYAEIFLNFAKNRQPFVTKTFGKKFNIPSLEEASKLVELQKRFQIKAHEIRIPVVNSDISFGTLYKGYSYTYREIQQCLSKNFENILLDKDINFSTKLIEQYLSMFKKTWDNNFVISLDPVITNFGIDYRGNLKYFDFFPAYQKLDNGIFFNWPTPLPELEEFVIKRHFSYSQSLVIYSQILRVLCRNRNFPHSMIKDMTKIYLGEKALELINKCSENQLKTIQNKNPHESDEMRVIGCELCIKGLISSKELERVFNLTHVYPNKIPNKDEFNKAVLILKKGLNKIS